MMEFFLSVLIYANVLMPLTAAIINLYDGIAQKDLDKGKRVVYIVIGIVSLYFSFSYGLILHGLMDASTVGVYLVRPAVLAIFFALIWNNIADRKITWKRGYLCSTASMPQNTLQKHIPVHTIRDSSHIARAVPSRGSHPPRRRINPGPFHCLR